MAFTNENNSTIESIIRELSKLDLYEQKEFLAQLKAKRLLKRKRKSLANPVKGSKPLTMAQIDLIKHESRKQQCR